MTKDPNTQGTQGKSLRDLDSGGFQGPKTVPLSARLCDGSDGRMKWMNGLGSFHRIGTVAVPKASRRRVGTDWDRLGRGRLAGWRRCNCSKNQETPCLGQWEAGTWPPAPFKPSEHARTGVPYQKVRRYKGVAVHTSIPTDNAAVNPQGHHVPVPGIMPQTGGQRAFREVHPGPLRFHPPTPKAPSKVH